MAARTIIADRQSKTATTPYAINMPFWSATIPIVRGAVNTAVPVAIDIREVALLDIRDAAATAAEYDSGKKLAIPRPAMESPTRLSTGSLASQKRKKPPIASTDATGSRTCSFIKVSRRRPKILPASIAIRKNEIACEASGVDRSVTASRNAEPKKMIDHSLATLSMITKKYAQ